MTNSLEELIQLLMRRQWDDLEGKERKKVVKRTKKKKSCTYCSKSGHTEDECWAKRAAKCSKEKDNVSKEQADARELAAHVMTMGSTHLPLLCLFMAQHTSVPVQRDWVVDSTTSAHMCCEHDPFDSHHPLQSPHLTTPGNGKTVSTPDVGDTLNWAPMPLIAGNHTLHEKFTKLQLNKLKSNGFNGENWRLAIASTNSLSHVTINGIYLMLIKQKG